MTSILFIARLTITCSQLDAAAKGAPIVGEQIEAEHDAVQLAPPLEYESGHHH